MGAATCAKAILYSAVLCDYYMCYVNQSRQYVSFQCDLSKLDRQLFTVVRISLGERWPPWWKIKELYPYCISFYQFPVSHDTDCFWDVGTYVPPSLTVEGLLSLDSTIAEVNHTPVSQTFDTHQKPISLRYAQQGYLKAHTVLQYGYTTGVILAQIGDLNLGPLLKSWILPNES